MRKQIALGAVLALVASAPVLAADDLSYNLFEGGYGYTDVDGSSGHADTFSLGGSFAFGTSFLGFGSVSTTDYSGANAKGLSLGLGFHADVSDSVDFISTVSYELSDPEGASSEDGFGVSVGLRGRASDKVELAGSVKYADYGHGLNGLAFGVGGNYYFTDMFAVGLSLAMDDEADSKTIGLNFRYDFGT